jgi:UDP-glucose 4-epimerase
LTATCLVTGAAGCVGRALLERLAARGDRVVGMDLLPQPAGLPAAEWIEGDILDKESYSGRLSGIETVFHLAAKAHSTPRTREEADRIREVNLDGTRLLLETFASEGVRRFVHVSTVAVLPPAGNGFRDAYAESKRKAEKAVLDFTAMMKIVIVRPATVYGPHDNGNIVRLVRWIEKGLPPIIGPGNNRKSMVYVGTLVEALVFLSERGENGEAYVVTDGRDLTMREFVESICSSLGVRNRWPAIPTPLARGIAATNDFLSDTLGIPRLLGREAIDKLMEETVFDSTSLFSLGFSPVCGIEEGIARTVRWYKDSTR